MRLLLIQSRMRPDMIAIEQEEYRRAIAETAELVAISSLDEDMPWENPTKVLEGFDGVIIGGSGDFYLDGGRTEDDPARSTATAIRERLRPLIEYIVTNDIPMLGVCFGHQLVGDVLGGIVSNDLTQAKTGTFEVSPVANDDLFVDMPSTFAAQYGHKDSITTLPRGATLVASAPNCRHAGLRYGRRVYTTQFHPELRAEDVLRRLKNSPGYLPEGVDAASIVRPSPEASTLIRRFVELV